MTTKGRHAHTAEALRTEVQELRTRNEALQSELYDFEYAHRIVQGEDATYCGLVRRVREAVRDLLPRDSIVAVVSKGDESLIDLFGREAWHFPRAPDGRYAGYYPKRDISAIAHLEVLRARGADYFLIPDASAWWLDHYPKLRLHLDDRYRRTTVPDTCQVYALQEPVEPSELSAPAQLSRFLADHEPFLGDYPAILDWNTGMRLAAGLPHLNVFSPVNDDATLPYLDGSVDVVVIATKDRPVALEALRVAARVVLNLAGRPLGRRPETRAVQWKMRDPVRRVPTVSIVIPCHDGLKHTSACVTSLRETLPPWFRGEVIIVDDASSDGTTDYVQALCDVDRRFRLLRNESNMGFLASCNAGAAAAKGDFLLFLNNDTVLLPAWMPPLLRTFADFPDSGAVGGKLLFEDGLLQEAGGLMFADGSAAKIGYRDADVEAPFHEYLREADYVSAALLMTPRELFHRIGGLDRRYGFGYYDDDDYCFAVRAAGRRVYYQPESVIVHVEGATAGTDLTAGKKQYQVTNQVIFAEKWVEELARRSVRPNAIEWSFVHQLETLRPHTNGNR